MVLGRLATSLSPTVSRRRRGLYLEAMSGDLEPWDLNEPTQDAIQSGAFALVQILATLVPGVAVPVAAAAVIREGANTRRHRKIITAVARELQQAAASRREQGERIEDLTAILEDEDSRLIPLVESTFAQMRETAEGHKMNRLRRSLATALLDPHSEESDAFVRLVVRYDDLAIYVLRQLEDPHTFPPQEVEKAPERIWQSIEVDWPGQYNPGQIRATTTALEADGLVVSKPEHEMMAPPDEPGILRRNESPSVALTITPRGQRFLNFLRLGNSRHPESDSATDSRAS
jgi:hypothetical protein